MNQSLFPVNTGKLRLRPMVLTDAEAVFAYRSDTETNRYQGWVPKSITEVEDFIEHKVARAYNQAGSWYQLVVEQRIDGKIIGDIGIHFIDDAGTQVELGVTIAKDYQHQGIARKALKKVIDHLFEDLNIHKLRASADPENKKAINLLEQLGFQLEVRMHDSLLIDGEWVDDLLYGLLRHEWSK